MVLDINLLIVGITAIYTSIESLYRTSETNTKLYLNKKKNKENNKTTL